MTEYRAAPEIALIVNDLIPTHHSRLEGVRIGVGATLERTVILHVAGVRESLVVQGSCSHVEARSSGFSTRFGPDVIRTMPEMKEWIAAAKREPEDIEELEVEF